MDGYQLHASRPVCVLRRSRIALLAAGPLSPALPPRLARSLPPARLSLLIRRIPPRILPPSPTYPASIIHDAHRACTPDWEPPQLQQQPYVHSSASPAPLSHPTYSVLLSYRRSCRVLLENLMTRRRQE
ncbi:hypothetical protein Bbelb_204770 [Branchiostoma belcheri]|nr:hypothetical protein Bbelb_204770 [Branchiostoma belcheri]